MPLSIFSLLLGTLFYLIGFPLIFAEKETLAWKKKFFKDTVGLRFVGALLVFASTAVLRMQWRVTPDAEGLVVLVAWLSFFKGLFFAWWPRHSLRILAWEEKKFAAPVWQILYGLLLVFVGAFFVYLSFLLV